MKLAMPNLPLGAALPHERTLARDGMLAMTESKWKMVMSPEGLTISDDTFSLTTSGSEVLDSVVSTLQTVSRGTYGQYCGLSRAVEAVGERWGLMIVRDLLAGPKSSAELYRGLPRVPKDLLTVRLRELVYSGIVEKDETPGANGEDRYRLTDYGRELDEIVLALGRWGAAMLAEPRPDDIVTEDSMMTGMRATFLPEAAAGRFERFELHFGDVVIHAIVEDGRLEVGRGPLADAQEIHPGPMFRRLLTRDVSVQEALASGTVKVSAPAVLESFVSLFGLSHQPAPVPSKI
jgi:DNA-binding HxlR family transcriptional regulator